MAVKLFLARGHHDVLAVGGGRSWNPGSPELAQELVDAGVVRLGGGAPVSPGTWYPHAATTVSVALWTRMNGGQAPSTPS